ncbi:Dihem cytochrome c [Hyella patelloides LEGE 07179]|uniref:Dihem cytochrome c n=1 Tax=Hyella patelloides LEGE 07179 TaxID=945734 RepID=A0A563VPR6_9CYAN|nr:cytochrome C [Hyella patelloides]VEP13400.1 Dihem cytochrome c [Hyella patelloides LEGE 07179]
MPWRMKISLCFLIIGISWCLGIDTVLAENNNLFFAQANTNSSSLGRELYLENCASCHIPIPAEVLPTERWQDILNNTQNHYGVTLPTSVRVTARLMWTYLKQYSRPYAPGETLPQYVTNSRYLKALHPQVELPQPTVHQSCVQCHPSAAKLDYRSLSTEWLDGRK